MMTPTLVASRTALPPEGALFVWGRPGVKPLTPTLVASRTALPPEGALFSWGRPGVKPLTPTLVASRTAGLHPLSPWERVGVRALPLRHFHVTPESTRP